MSRRLVASPRNREFLAWASVVAVMLSGLHVAVHAGFGNNGNNFNAVGGVMIDANGVVADVTVEARQQARDFLRRAVKPAEGELKGSTEMRMISLRGLEQAIRDAKVENTQELPDEVRYLAGLQRVQYVFVFPERQDVVLAGPAEGWAISETGDVVGETTGKPVLHLADLMTALQSTDAARQGQGISVSIDPTAEGRQNFRRYMANVKQFSPEVAQGVCEALGPQQITLTGVPTDSRFARVLVAADYQMKRLAMDLQEAPIEDLPSFLDLMARRRTAISGNVMPRWWLACDYQPVAKSEDGLAYELRGQGVKAMTEDEFVSAIGTVEGTGKVNPMAQAWADKMTERYDALSAAQPIFGDLRNIMDLSVVAALIETNGLLQQANLELPVLKGQEPLVGPSFPTPRQVSTQCSFTRVGRNWAITASGGVQVDSFGVVQKQQVDPMMAVVRSKADATGMGRWWWN